jgi:hypothetical protein
MHNDFGAGAPRDALVGTGNSPLLRPGAANHISEPNEKLSPRAAEARARKLAQEVVVAPCEAAVKPILRKRGCVRRPAPVLLATTLLSLRAASALPHATNKPHFPILGSHRSVVVIEEKPRNKISLRRRKRKLKFDFKQNRLFQTYAAEEYERSSWYGSLVLLVSQPCSTCIAALSTIHSVPSCVDPHFVVLS